MKKLNRPQFNYLETVDGLFKKYIFPNVRINKSSLLTFKI